MLNLLKNKVIQGLVSRVKSLARPRRRSTELSSEKLPREVRKALRDVYAFGGEKQVTAIRKLGAAKQRAARDKLHDLLYSNNDSQYEAAKALGKMAHPESIQKLFEVIEDTTHMHRIYDPRLRMLCGIALKKISENPVVPDHPDLPVLRKAISLIDPTSHPNAFTAVYKCLRKPEYAGKSGEWWELHARELKAKETSLKQGEGS